MLDKSDEYRSLREEIIQRQQRREQVFNFVLTAVVAIFGFSVQLQNPYLPLFALLPLLFGKVQIAHISNGLDRAATYIRLALEPGAGLRWETLSYEFRRQNTKYGLRRISSLNVLSNMLFLTGVIAWILALLLSRDLGIAFVLSIIFAGWIAFWRWYNSVERKIREEDRQIWNKEYPPVTQVQKDGP